MSYGEQSSESRESRGLMPGERGHFSSLAPGLFSNVQRASGEAARDPGGLGFMPMVDRLLPVGRFGVPLSAESGVFQLGRDLYSQASGAGARSGRVTPYNLEGILGDAIRMAAPSLIPIQTQTAFQRAQMAPALRQAALGFEATPMQILSNLLSASGESASSSRGFGFGLTGAGEMGAAAITAAFPPSDRRLKSNIVKLGVHPLGIGWYEYTINGEREQGVMADEVLTVMPKAVHIRPDGFLSVDYSLIGRVKV